MALKTDSIIFCCYHSHLREFVHQMNSNVRQVVVLMLYRLRGLMLFLIPNHKYEFPSGNHYHHTKQTSRAPATIVRLFEHLKQMLYCYPHRKFDRGAISGLNVWRKAKELYNRATRFQQRICRFQGLASFLSSLNFDFGITVF